MFYKGYIKTVNKKSMERFKGVSSFKTLSQVQDLSEYAGVLAEDAILIDIDDRAQADMLIDICDKENIRCRVLQSRSGAHFLFKNSVLENCPTHTKLACGLTADIKSGAKSAYEVLKIEGKERKVLYDILEGEEYQEIPKWLYPIRSGTEFTDMEAGSGRNQALFNYILTLQSNDFTTPEARETIRIINKYVLKDPLSDSELDVILREDSFKKPVFFNGTNFLHDKFAVYIKNNNHIIKINGQLHVYKNGIYISGQEEIESIMIQHINSLSRAKRAEVYAYLCILIMDNTPMAPANLIAFRNGIYDRDTDKLTSFSPDIVLTNRIPWDYNPNAYSEIADKTLNKIACQDKQIRQILNQCIGSCFYRSNTLGGGKCFILTGEGSNGKSTFLTMIQTMLGEENIASLDLKELDAKFQNAELFGKLANVGDDISDEFIVNASVFKKLVTGNRVQVQRKGEKPFEFNNYSKMLFSANSIPRIKDKSGAVLRRLLIIPFNARFSVADADYDNSIVFKLQSQEVMEYLIQLGISALKDVIINKAFTESEKIKVEIEEYEEINNPVKAFLSELSDEGYVIENQPIPEVWERYDGFCRLNGFQAMSKPEFTKQIKRLRGLETKQLRLKGNKNPVRIFVRKENESAGR